MNKINHFEVSKGLNILGPEVIHNIVMVVHHHSEGLERSRQTHSRTWGQGVSLHFIKRVEGNFIWLDKEQ